MEGPGGRKLHGDGRAIPTSSCLFDQPPSPFSWQSVRRELSSVRCRVFKEWPPPELPNLKCSSELWNTRWAQGPCLCPIPGSLDTGAESVCVLPPTHSTLTQCTPSSCREGGQWLAKVWVYSRPHPTDTFLTLSHFIRFDKQGVFRVRIRHFCVLGGGNLKQCLIFFFKSTFCNPILLVSFFFFSFATFLFSLDIFYH